MRIVAILLSLCMLQAAHAQSAPLGRCLASAHGGQTHMAGPYYLELVIGEGRVVVYVTDRDGQAVDTAGAKGRAVVHTDGRGVAIEIHPGAGNMLEGTGRFRLKPSSVVYVTVDLKHAPPHRAVFRPFEGKPVRALGRTRR